MTDQTAGGMLQLRPITSTVLLVDFAIEHGMPRASVLRHTGIRERALLDPDGSITRAQEVEVMRNIVRGIRDEPGLGLQAGLMCRPPLLGALACAVMSQPTVRRALEVGLRYADLSCSFARFTVESHDDEIWLIREDSVVPEEIRRFSVEHDLGALASMQRELLPPRWHTKRVEVTVDPHPIYDGFAMVLGVGKLVFNAPRTMLVFGVDVLDTPMPQASPTTARCYEKQCAALLQRRRDYTGVSGQVRQLLIRRGQIADQLQIAADLDVSVRTLRRQLADEGITFREISTETLGMLAEQLLIAGYTVESAADRLGYSSVSGFASAFRARKGQTPGQFARDHRTRTGVRV